MKQYRKLAVIGGGSALWTPDAVAKMACSSSMRQAEIVLYDVNYERAGHIAELCMRMLRRGYPGVEITVRAVPVIDMALDGAEVVVTCFCNMGIGVEERINAISRKYGSHQACFTAGPGALIYLAIQGPVLIDVVQVMRNHCPDAWLVNCSNPLPAMGMVAVKAGFDPRRVLGFCGALSWARRDLARFLQVDPARLEFRIGGTNHCTFFTEVRVDGKDAYPLVRQRALEQPYFDLGCWGRSTMEIELLKAIGYLPMGGHASDIFPTIHGEWMPPGPDAPPKPANFGGNFVARLEAYTRGEAVEINLPQEREVPFSWLDALAGDTSEGRFSINIVNLGAVPNLPDWCVPDLECQVDEGGVTPVAGPPLPEVIAEVVRRHHVTFEMAARAVIERDRELLKQAIQLCPYGNYLQAADAILADARKELGEGFLF